MRSSKNRRAVIVGIVIVIGIVIFVSGIFALGGQHNTFSRTITLNAVFDDVSGLQKGNNIWISGVKVGIVQEIKFNDKAQVIVILSIQKKMNHLIHKDAKAKISSDGLIGNRLIVIYGGSPQAPLIEEGDMIGEVKQSSTQAIIDTLQQNNKNLLEITGNIKTLTQNMIQGQGTVGKLLTDETLFTSLQSTMGQLNKASENARSLTSDLSGFSAQLHAKGTFANDLVTDTVIFRKLRATTTQLKEVANTASGVADELKKASANLNDNANSPLGVLLNDPKAAEDLRVTLKNLNAGTYKLNEDLEAAQHSFLLKGFFKKKAKAAGKEK